MQVAAGPVLVGCRQAGRDAKVVLGPLARGLGVAAGCVANSGSQAGLCTTLCNCVLAPATCATDDLSSCTLKIRFGPS